MIYNKDLFIHLNSARMRYEDVFEGRKKQPTFDEWLFEVIDEETFLQLLCNIPQLPLDTEVKHKALEYLTGEWKKPLKEVHKTNSDKPKNMDVYKTPKEQAEAFRKFCEKQPLRDGVQFCASGKDCVVCKFEWLNLEAEQEVQEDD